MAGGARVSIRPQSEEERARYGEQEVMKGVQNRRSVQVNAERLKQAAAGTGLERLAPVFAAAGRKYGVDPDLLMAIAMHETGNGTSSAFRNKRNAMGVSDAKGPRTFGSVEESVFYMARQLKRNYIDKGLSDVASIGAKYAPIGAGNDPGGLNAHWVSGVNRNLKAIKG
ncbi:hypothetical protein AC781_11380 [Akkermansia glycaniphila]|nr:hypothetical protein AC781_11380 [Akkermansia glycaniphila]